MKFNLELDDGSIEKWIRCNSTFVKQNLKEEKKCPERESNTHPLGHNELFYH
jgi:hypothetical protein